MEDFPEEAIEIAKYFENTYLGKVLPDQSRRRPMFPIRVWNLFSRINNNILSSTNKHSVEGWHNAFASMVVCSHPSFSKLHFSRGSNQFRRLYLQSERQENEKSSLKQVK